MADSKPIQSAAEVPRTIRVYRSYRVELDPNNKQRTLFLKACGIARFVYNWSLARRIKQYKETGKSQTARFESRDLNAVKDEQFPWMRDVSCYVVEESLKNLDKGFEAFFRRCKNGEKPGFPRFKSRKRGVGGFRVRREIRASDRSILLPRIGWVRMKERNYVPIGAITSATVKEVAGRWFVSVHVEEEIAVPENQGSAVGIDLGLTSLVTFSDGRKVTAPKTLVRSLEKLRRLSRQHSRKQNESANRKKSARKLARLHYRIACQRGDFLNKLTTDIVRSHSAIGVESLNVRGLIRNQSLSRAIADAGWSELLRQLQYKSQWNGAMLVEASQFFPSTKTCSECGRIKDSMPLSERVYRCECGLELNRDVNAARNLLSLCTASSAGINACGDDAIAPSVKQEPSSAPCA